MQSKQAKFNPKQDKAASVARAKSIIEGYHEGNTIEDRVIRKEITIHMLICLISSPWWLAINETDRSNIIHHIVQVDETQDALDVMYN